MCERHPRFGRSSRASLATLVVVFQGLFVLGAGQASAAPTCSIASGTMTLTDDGAGLDSIDVWQDTAGKVFVTVGPTGGVTAPNGLCGNGVDVASIQDIRIIGGTGLSLVTIWMSQVLAATPASAPYDSEGPGADWGTIDWSVDLSDNADVNPGLEGIFVAFGGGLAILSQSPVDPLFVTAGSAGIDLDTDGDLDVSLIDVPRLVLQALNGAGSALSAAGGGSTGDPMTIPVSFVGGAGDDTLLGGDGRDFFLDGSGDDTISGGGGGDIILDFGGQETISGGAGADLIRSGPGDDVVDAGSGNDNANGGGGDDQLSGGPGNDHLNGGRGDDLIEGDGGHDRCDGGPGEDVVHCEIGRVVAR